MTTKAKPKAGPTPKAPQNAKPEDETPPSVKVVLALSEQGAMVADIELHKLGLDQAQWWLEEGIKHLRRSFEKP